MLNAETAISMPAVMRGHSLALENSRMPRYAAAEESKEANKREVFQVVQRLVGSR